jgi:hypothetical protein
VVLQDLYEEVSNVLTLEQFEELYDAATTDQFGSLIIDCPHKDKRFMCGLDYQLLIKYLYIYIIMNSQRYNKEELYPDDFDDNDK